MADPTPPTPEDPPAPATCICGIKIANCLYPNCPAGRPGHLR